jgi:integrase
MYSLLRFDAMCYERYPDECQLTREICMAWATKGLNENNNSFRNRISPIREFARFLARNGESAYIIPIDMVKKNPPAAPYIFSQSEIAAIWKEYDKLPQVPHLPIRNIVLPAFMRILYCCGLRPIEACRLYPADVDLNAGKLHIRESKGHKDRIVMMAHDVTAYMREYDKQVNGVIANRQWFFPNVSGNICDNRWLSNTFRQVRDKLCIGSVCGNKPTLYSFRHTYATHRLYGWLRSGEDLNVKLPYLSAYMGHTQLSDTYYYIRLVPEQLQIMTGIDFSRYEKLLPEVECDERFL